MESGTEFRVARLTPATREDFFKIHSEGAGFGSCQCVAWWTPSWQGWSERTAQQNRMLRQKLFAEGVDDGYIAYDGAEPIGWCQVWRRDAFGKLREQFRLAPDHTAWMLGCFLVLPRYRKRGVAKSMLKFILADLRTRGATSVDAFPKRDVTDADELWNGPEPLFLAAGFRVVTENAKRPLLRLSFH